ncbi:dipeptidyl aminopeptidase/acylaminoacyl peptidase [Salsuginibacillus halophilus]|uniref:Dipeptidyl aminopeptidase/acylaminoacyl peptidase n=1 Tax=Salsuginibacillus halophilus TaxID=517424 RepID=A0A2P8HFU6_9BACI|nr:S9 family peptidase [Salsuginibacillus halophilus]PSL45073.1 dipeptidyl aminopeptidase/acylaminoacyl peptidase [Salsuginibacillus halophilus]
MDTNKRPIQTDDLYRMSVTGEAKWSPDGDRYIFTQTEIDENEKYVTHLHTQSIVADQPEQWTHGNVRDIKPAWAPDGTSIAFLSNRSGKNQIWLLPTTGGEARQLTNLPNGAGAPVWSRDGLHLLFSAPLAPDDDINDTPAEKDQEKPQPLVVENLKYKSDAEGFRSEQRRQLVLLNLQTHKLTQLTDAPVDHQPWEFSPDGTSITFTANRHEDHDHKVTSDIFILDLSSKHITRLTDSTGMYTHPSFSPDGKYLASIGHEYEYDGATLNQVWMIDLTSHKRTCLTEKWDVQIGDAMIGDIRSVENPGPIWSQDQAYIYFTASDHGHTGLYRLDMEGEITTVYQEDNHVYYFSYHKSSHSFLLGVSDPSNPGDIFFLQPGDKGKRRLTDVNSKFLREVSLSIPEPITAAAEDGWEIHGWIMRPADFDETKTYPLVLEIHGGPHAMYGQTFFHELQLLAAQGYVVLYTNPRGSHGYGQTFVNACRGDYGGRDYTDLMSAVDHVLSSYNFIDENRLGVTGGSYGGFMTNWIVGHTNRFKAAVTQRSISNWLSFYGVSDIGFFFTKWEIGRDLLEDPQKLWDHSPLKYADQIETPLLILHSENDLRCPMEQGEQLFATLKHLRKETKFVRFPEANHELSRSGPPHLRKERLNHICAWFEQYL